MVVRVVNIGSMVHAGDILTRIDLILSQLPGLAELELQFFDAPNPQYHRVHAFTPTWLIEHGLPSVTSRPQGVLRELRVTNATIRQVNYVQLQLIVSILARCTGLLSLHLGPRIGGVLPCAADIAPYTQSTASEAIIMSALEGIALNSLGFGWVPFALASALLGGPRKTTLRTLAIQSPMYTNGMVRDQPAQISWLPSLLSRINGLSSISTLIITPPDTWLIRSFVEVVPAMWTMPSLRRIRIGFSVLSEIVLEAYKAYRLPELTGLMRVTTLELLCGSPNGIGQRSLPYALQKLAETIEEDRRHKINGLVLREILLAFPLRLATRTNPDVLDPDVSYLRGVCMAKRIELRIVVESTD